MQWDLAAKILSLSRRGCIATWKLTAAKRQTWQRRRLSEASHERHRRCTWPLRNTWNRAREAPASKFFDLSFVDAAWKYRPISWRWPGDADRSLRRQRTLTAHSSPNPRH